MKQNLGNLDVAIRVVAGVSLLIVLWVDELTAPLSWIFIVLSFLLLLTGLSGSCPIYRVLQISSRKHQKAKTH